MLPTTRLVRTGLAAAAVASAVSLTAAPAQADDRGARGCGLPEIPATYVTVSYEPVWRVVPAITHLEWRWQRDVAVEEHQYVRVVRDAYTETQWTRTIAPTAEHLWSRTVVDQELVPAVPGIPEQGHLETVIVEPAVTVTLFEYVQQKTGRTTWRPADWNGEPGDQDHGKGWRKTGNTREEIVEEAVTEDRWVVDRPAVPGTPEVPEVSHLETVWAEHSPGEGWSGPLDTRAVGGGTESTTTSGGTAPAGDGWTPVGTTVHDAVLETVWALTAPAGFTSTGSSRTVDVVTEETRDGSATPPEGAGWTPVAGSAVEVVDVPAVEELVEAGRTEDVLVDPGQPATAPCPHGAASGVQGGGVTTGTGASAGTPSHAAPTAAVGADAAPAPTATILPATGNQASPWLVAMGAGALVAGGVLVRAGRRRVG